MVSKEIELRISFLATILEDQWKDVNLLVFSDWLEENQEVDFAYALKWLVNKKKRPGIYKTKNGVKYLWLLKYQDARYDSPFRMKLYKKFNYAIVSQRIFIKTHIQDYCRYFNSWEQAVFQLGVQLKEIRDEANVH